MYSYANDVSRIFNFEYLLWYNSAEYIYNWRTQFLFHIESVHLPVWYNMRVRIKWRYQWVKFLSLSAPYWSVELTPYWKSRAYLTTWHYIAFQHSPYFHFPFLLILVWAETTETISQTEYVLGSINTVF